MSSRHTVPQWRYVASVLGLLLTPLIAAAALALTSVGLFTAVIGALNHEIALLAAGVGATALGWGAGWLARRAWRGRKMLLRAQRMLLGTLVIAAASVTLALSPREGRPATVVAVGSGSYAMFGFMLIVNASRDRWSA